MTKQGKDAATSGKTGPRLRVTPPDARAVECALARLRRAEALHADVRARAAALTAEIEALREEVRMHEAARQQAYANADEPAAERIEVELDRAERAIERKAGIYASVNGPITQEHQRAIFLAERDAREAAQQWWVDYEAACWAELEQSGALAIMHAAHRAASSVYGPALPLYLQRTAASHLQRATAADTLPAIPTLQDLQSAVLDPHLRQELNHNADRRPFHPETASAIESVLAAA